ncbi:NAD-dependent protein deacetylase Sirt2 [Drosophila albomicans]|uniref:NAD-dependent protein deacetylase Sirt2 n=1 Tax=Drosophila albomicans TaxID=7291 RepID=A0A6P8XX62_DROAB|nr:NAD-dependent protein deacetylase Sirt2 [Drosophila albomicans]
MSLVVALRQIRHTFLREISNRKQKTTQPYTFCVQTVNNIWTTMSEKKESDKNYNEKKQDETTTSSNSDDSDNNEEDKSTMDVIRRFFSQTLNLGSSTSPDDEVAVDKVMPELTFEGLIRHWREHGFKNIVTMVGAGISTSAGIPDFRSPGTGLYNNLKKYKLPDPTAIFDVDYFQKNPTPFFALAKELYPGSFEPTPAHYFVRLLHDKGLLQRHYTQNIDTLDRLAGLPDDKIIEAHGSFYTNHCLKCKRAYDMAWMKEQIFSDKLPRCECKGLVKPDIVFFGENLPSSFYTSPDEDFKDCDLLIIMGTSLEVMPFASLIQRAGPRCVRLLINRDAVGRSSFAPWMDPAEKRSLLYGKAKNVRDVAYLGDCDAGVLALAEALGWDKELQQLIDAGQQLPDDEEEEEKEKEAASPMSSKQ